MLKTIVTQEWGLRYPIIGAPMANIARGRMARAVTEAGGLGCIGVGPRDTSEFIERESAIARGDGTPLKFGIGLMVWVLETRPELFDAAIAQKPFLLSISFGSVRKYVDRAHQAGILIATQVNTRKQIMEALSDGADIIVAQGSDAGGHSGFVATLPVLQIALEASRKPVFAAGGIASPAGVAAALAAGAEAAWVGTAFLLSPESDGTDAAKDRIAAASESDTVLTTVFDRASQLAWPPHHPGRALRNQFSDKWHGREDELAANADEIARFRQSAKDRNYDVTSIYAGQAVGLMSERRAAPDVVRWLGEGAEELLRKRMLALMPS
jgi:nitronate monooxygenase